jgi:hypothetical protein
VAILDPSHPSACDVCGAPVSDRPPPSFRLYRCCQGCDLLASDVRADDVNPPINIVRAVHSLEQALSSADLDGVASEGAARNAIVSAHRRGLWNWAGPQPATVHVSSRPPGVRIALSYSLANTLGRGTARTVRPDAALRVSGASGATRWIAVELKLPPIAGYKSASEVQRGWGQCLLYCNGRTTAGHDYHGAALVIVQRSRRLEPGILTAHAAATCTIDGSPRWLWHLLAVCRP